uniref:Uncharacterized protein n=1 Tax=Plectus sambesii TaxID=2011161 RepID=A0A914X068_9BILA
MPLNLSSAPMTIDEGTDQKAEWGAVAAGFGAISDDVRGGFQFNLDETTDAFGRSTAKGRAARFNEPLEYGADYAVMTLDLLSRKRRVDPTIATLSTRYLEALYAPTKSAQSLRTTRADVKRRFVKGSKYEALTGMRAWTLLKSEEELLQLSTFTVQSYICAALNCRRLLRMVFGVSSNETVDGIEMTMVDRDKLRQGIDFAMSREFIPPLDPDIYSVDFVPVMDPSNHRVVVENLFVVEITLKRLSSQVSFTPNASLNPPHALIFLFN